MLHRAGRWIVTLIAAASATACGQAADPSPFQQSPPAPSESGASTPGESASASGDATAEAAVVAEGVISTDDEEYRITFAPDGQTAYFARGAGFFPQSREATIYETRLVDGEWSEPTIASFSGTYPDLDPWVSADGESIYFSSIRPVGGDERTDVELFRVDRSEDGWSEPVHLASLGSEADELGASVSADGTIWFASDRSGGAGGWDLYTAAPDSNTFGAPLPVEGLNSAAWEFNPAIDAEGTTLLFTSISRPGGVGLGDLFVATRDGGTWADAQPLTINTGADEYHPSRSPDGETLYFLKRATDGDLFSISWAAADPGR